jgi:hypothetical protein
MPNEAQATDLWVRKPKGPRRAPYPSVYLVAGARNAECYTVAEVYWTDLRR